MKRNLLFSFVGISLLSLLMILLVKTDRNDNLSDQKQQWSELISNHPYNNRPYKSDEEWKKVPKADRPDLAMEQDVLMTMDPALGVVPIERKLKANKAVEEILKTKGAIPGVEWQERGPNNVGGRTRALMFDPNDVVDGYKKVFAAGVGGGLWYTDDITADPPTWNHVDGFWDNIAVTCIAYDPSDTDVMYVGTGEGFFNADAQMGAGIWKSTDGGSTWAQLANTDPGAYNSSSDFHYVNKIVVKADGTVFAATRGYYTNTGGIIRSIDGGTNWSNVLSVYQASTTYYDRAADIEIAANGDLYASFGLFSSAAVYKSLHADNGGSATWTDISSNIGVADAMRVELACAPSDANTIYAVAHGGSGDDDIEWFKKSINGGDSWSNIATPLMADGSGNHFTRGQAFYDLILAVHPTDASYVLVGGIDLHRTANGGTSWSPISHWYGGFSQPEVHADQHAIQFRPGASNEVIFGNDGGVYYSTNAGNSSATPSFLSKNNGYNVTQFYACAAKNEVNSNYFLAGAQDNGSQKFSSPQIGSTVEVSGGDGAFCHIDQLNSDIQSTAYTYNAIYRSTDGGNSFSKDINDASGHFINPSDYDSQSKILYSAAADNKVKRISGFDGSLTNTDISIDVGSSGSAQVSALKVSPYNDVLFLGIENGRIYKLTGASTGSPSLSRIDAAPIINTGWVSSIDIGADDDHIMVTYSNYGVTSIWETTDGGNNWYSKEGDLPDMPVRWALYNPEDRNEVLLATEVGVWSTDNFGTGTNSAPAWDVSSAGLAYTRCTMLKYRAADKMVVVSTHGRGLFTSDVFTSISDVNFSVDQNISCTGSLTVQFIDGSLNPNDSWAWDVDNNGTTDYTTQNPSHTYSSPGVYSVKLSINGGAQEITKENLIMVLSGEPTTNTGCSISANDNLDNGFGYGISRFILENIDNSTSNNDGGYQNYTCTHGTSLELNTSYNITIQTGVFNNEGAKVYIDYNDNGEFDESTEKVAEFPSNMDGSRTLSFTTPSSGVEINKGLRLRAISARQHVPTGPCDNTTMGQAEDYTVYFKEAEPTWIGAVSSSWTATGNWSGGVVPTASDNAIIANAGIAPIIADGVGADCNNLTIHSGATLTVASGGSLITAGTITNNGTFDVQATFTNAAWHMISSPVEGAQSGMFDGDYMQNWNSTAEIWTDISILTEPLTPGKGFAFYSNDGATIHTFSGTPNTGSVSYSYPSKADTYGDMLLVGNPYPSSIDWSGLVAYGTIYRFDPNANDYNEWGAGSLNNANQYVAPAQGFFIYNPAHNAFTVNNVNRVHNSSTFYKVSKNYIGIELFATFGEFKDDLTINIKDDASSTFDLAYDAVKIVSTGNGQSQIYTKHNDYIFAIDALPEVESIQLGFQNNVSGEYSIGVKENYSLGIVELEDTKIHIFHDLLHSAYEFDWNSYDSEERFILHLKATGLEEEEIQEAQVYASNQQVYIRLNESLNYDQAQIYDLSGRLVGAYPLDQTELQSITLLTKGAYLVKLSGESGSQTEKIIIK